MKPAPDASVIDTTGMGLDHVIDQIEQDVRSRMDPNPLVGEETAR